MDKIQLDMVLLRKAFNERVSYVLSRSNYLTIFIFIGSSYFRQLQEISDTVVEPTWDGRVTDAIATGERQRNELDAKINTGRARLRYLDYLVKAENGDGVADQDTAEERTCILCKCDFTRGYITQW